MGQPGGVTQAVIRPPWALGLCDRCGFHFHLNDLHAETYDLRPNGLLVCRVCLDIDQEQLQLGRVALNDPQSLLNPRPDTGRQGSISLFGWLPAGNPLTNIQCQVGVVEVLIA